MKQSLQISLSQHLALTPQLKQSLKLLQLSSMDLEQEIQNQLDSNPLLEKAESEVNLNLEDSIPPTHTPLQDNNIPQPIAESADPDAEYNRIDHLAPEQDLAQNLRDSLHTGTRDLYSSGAEQNYVEVGSYTSRAETLVEHLAWQLQMTTLSSRDKEIGHAIIHSLDAEGYLESESQEICNSFPDDWNVETDEVEAVLNLIKTFEPIGVGVRNLQERLLILLANVAASEELKSLAADLLSKHLDKLASHNYTAIMTAEGKSSKELSTALDLITSLNPRIGNQFGESNLDHVVPDILVKREKGTWLAEINPNNHRMLRVNETYAQLLKGASREGLSEQENEYIQANLNNAKMFIKGLMSRYDTLLLVGQTIVEKQQAFFEDGEQAMTPMVLNDIAEALEMHESTISRATSGKYLLSPRGVFELKYFFSSALSNAEGTKSSSTAIRSLIKQLVDGESKTKPLSDNKIAQELEKQGHTVARRTVAKYRESLQIAPSSQRKTLP